MPSSRDVTLMQAAQFIVILFLISIVISAIATVGYDKNRYGDNKNGEKENKTNICAVIAETVKELENATGDIACDVNISRIRDVLVRVRELACNYSSSSLSSTS